jgi:prepilin-type N-terminal cleavage/methylation domain-containing protein
MKARIHHAFTLIEILAVIGIITLMAGVFGLALRDGSLAVALQSAQGTVAGLLVAAREQAAAKQNRALLVVDSDPADDDFLRGVHVAIETAPNSRQWQITGDDALLPRGIFVVPGGAAVIGAVFPAGEGAGGAWPVGRISSLELASPGSISPVAGNPSGIFLRMTVPLTALGAAGAGGGDKIVLAAARRTPLGVIFDHPEWVRGVTLSSYGTTILVNDGPGFDF